jgi:DNA polymerase I-like protein with 3'-5' exonuclease and polymerase domains
MRIVAVDTETTGLRPEQGDVMRGFSWALPGGQAQYVSVSHPDTINVSYAVAWEVMQWVAGHDVVVMWNSPFDRTVIRLTFGIEFRDEQIYDAMLGDFVICESADHRLKFAAARILGHEAKAEKEALDALFRGKAVGECYAEMRAERLAATGLPRLAKGEAPAIMACARLEAAASKRSWATVTAAEIEEYAVQDARLTLAMHDWQQAYFGDHPEYLPALPRMHRVLGVAYRMRQAGLRVNVPVAEARMAEALERIEVLATAWPGVNLRSTQQVQAMVYDTWGLPCTRRTPVKRKTMADGTVKVTGGARSTAKEALAGLAYDPRVRDLLEFRKLTKRVDGLFIPLLNRTAEGGLVHASFNAYRAVTGRWSCSGPNLQQTERGQSGELFEAPPGWRYWSCDLPQAELRVAACISGEPVWLEEFQKPDADVYTATAEPVGVVRQVGKVMTLQLLYGSGARKLGETLTVATGDRWTVAETKPKVRAFWKSLPRLKRFMDGVGEAWIRYGKLPIKPWVGRYRHLINGRTGFPEGSYKAGNSLVQGGVAEVVNDWAVAVEDALAGTPARLVAQIHDSLGIMAPEDWTKEQVTALFTAAWVDVNPYRAVPWPLTIKEGV